MVLRLSRFNNDNLTLSYNLLNTDWTDRRHVCNIYTLGDVSMDIIDRYNMLLTHRRSRQRGRRKTFHTETSNLKNITIWSWVPSGAGHRGWHDSDTCTVLDIQPLPCLLCSHRVFTLRVVSERIGSPWSDGRTSVVLHVPHAGTGSAMLSSHR